MQVSIASLVRNEARQVNGYTAAALVKTSAYSGPLVITDDVNQVMGILNEKDLQKPYTLIIDCISDKPVVSVSQDIKEVLDIMAEYQADHLLVGEGDQIIGTISKQDLVVHLKSAVDEQSHVLHELAHDLKSPVASVITLMNLLIPDLSTHAFGDLLRQTQTACQHVLELIEDMLLLAQMDQGQMRWSDAGVNDLLSECIQVCEVAAKNKNIELNYALAAPSISIYCDRLKLRRAINNIIDNAIKFTPATGKITIDVRDNQHFAQISITDNGIGIPEALQKHLFDRFTTAKRPGTNGEPSSGLGMHISHRIITKMGGKLLFESKEGKGTTFYLDLPKYATS